MSMYRRSGITTVLGIAAAAVFLSVLFFSLFHTPVGMEMSGEMSGCPFMSHDAVLCSMSTLDHLSAWKSTFIVTLPVLTFLLFAFASVALFVSVAPNLRAALRRQHVLHSHHTFSQVHSFVYRPFQELFSNGILHPKLF